MNPTEHTLIIEADISSSVAKNTHQKIKEHLRNRIITTCGDADVMAGTKHIDPALHYAYVGGPAPRLVPFFFGGRPNFLKPSKLRKKQTEGEHREALLLTTQ